MIECRLAAGDNFPRVGHVTQLGVCCGVGLLGCPEELDAPFWELPWLSG